MTSPTRTIVSSEARSANGTFKSLAKVVRILECFSTTERTLHLIEICNRTGFPRSTTHRLLSAMRVHGFLDQDEERDRYRLGLRLFEFGNVVLANMDLHREARPFVDTLVHLTSQAVHVAVFDGREAVVIRRNDPSPEKNTSLNLIESAPAHCTSVGKAILAYQPAPVVERLIAEGLRRFTDHTITDPQMLRADLANIRERGYAVDNEEHQPGLRCVGAPIRDHSGRVFAAISVSGAASRLAASETGSLSKIVIHNADALSNCLGYRNAKNLR